MVRSTDAIAQLDTVSSEIDQLNTQKIATTKHQLTFDKTHFHCGEGERIESNALGLFFEWFAWLRTGRVVELKTYELRASQGGYYRLM